MNPYSEQQKRQEAAAKLRGAVLESGQEALQRLREMMGESGLNLADADVSDAHRDQRAQEGEADGGRRGRGGRGGEGGDVDDADAESGQVTSIGNGMLDLYA